MTDEPLLFECRETLSCTSTIVRSWSGLPTGSIVEFCVEVDDQTLCLKKKTVVDGDGSGNSTREGPPLGCGTDNMRFTIESEACGLSAGVTPTCSECFGDW